MHRMPVRRLFRCWKLSYQESETRCCVWCEHLLAHAVAGDANRVRQFSQLDIVQVLQRGKYMTGRAALLPMEQSCFQTARWLA